MLFNSKILRHYQLNINKKQQHTHIKIMKQLRTLQWSIMLWSPIIIGLAALILIIVNNITFRMGICTILFTEVLLVSIWFISSTLVYEKDPMAKFILGREFIEYRKKEPFAFIFLGSILFIGAMLLVTSIWMSFVGGKPDFLFFGYSSGVPICFSCSLLIFRWWKSSPEPKRRVMTEDEKMERAMHG